MIKSLVEILDFLIITLFIIMALNLGVTASELCVATAAVGRAVRVGGGGGGKQVVD